MKKVLFVLSGVISAFIASVGINATTVPVNMYVEPGTHSCLVSWDDEVNSAWNLRYRLYTEESEDPVLLHSITASAYSGSSYASITLPAPWGGTNVRAGRSEIYFRNNYNNDGSYGNITYTVPDGYTNATFILMITTYSSSSNGAGNLTVATPQTPAETHYFSAGASYSWTVTASSGEKITITTPDSQYSPSIALMGVYYVPTIEWTYVYNLDKTEYNIEGLEIATDYEVQVQAIGDDGTLSDWCRPDVFTTLEEDPIIPSVHILGDVDDQVWASDAGTKMEYDPETELYTATIHVLADKTFGFTTEIDANDELGGWSYVNLYRFGPESNGLFDLTDERLGQQHPLAWEWDNFSDVHVLTTGDYEVTVSLEKNYVIIGKIGHGYARGDVNHDGIINITDVTVLIDFLLTDNDTACQICADVNEDSMINITDVTVLINYLLTDNWEY